MTQTTRETRLADAIDPRTWDQTSEPTVPDLAVCKTAALIAASDALRTALAENARLRELLADALHELGADDSCRDYDVDEKIRAVLAKPEGER